MKGGLIMIDTNGKTDRQYKVSIMIFEDMVVNACNNMEAEKKASKIIKDKYGDDCSFNIDYSYDVGDHNEEEEDFNYD
jgi:hypothetical protein